MTSKVRVCRTLFLGGGFTAYSLVQEDLKGTSWLDKDKVAKSGPVEVGCLPAAFDPW